MSEEFRDACGGEAVGHAADAVGGEDDRVARAQPSGDLERKGGDERTRPDVGEGVRATASITLTGHSAGSHTARTPPLTDPAGADAARGPPAAARRADGRRQAG